jgi:hypothetical protein
MIVIKMAKQNLIYNGKPYLLRETLLKQIHQDHHKKYQRKIEKIQVLENELCSVLSSLGNQLCAVLSNRVYQMGDKLKESKYSTPVDEVKIEEDFEDDLLNSVDEIDFSLDGKNVNPLIKEGFQLVQQNI